MGRARRARRIAAAAAFGGGLGFAGVGAAGLVGYGIIRAEAKLARRAVGTPFEAAPDDSNLYGTGLGRPYQLVVLGDSLAAGLGAETKYQTIGGIIAVGVAAVAGRPVRLTNVAEVGAESSWLEGQVERALAAVAQPDVALITIGGNDVTHRIDRAVAVRHLGEAVRRLRAAGAEVVVGTCPDLGTIEPMPHPLRALVRYLGRDLAAAQTVAVIEAGGRTVSLGDLLGPEFMSSPREMFSVDRFHPSAIGYARVASALLPSICAALNLWSGTAERPPDRLAGEGIEPVGQAAAHAVREPGTEVSATDVAGRPRGPGGRWAVLRHRRRPQLPTPGDQPERQASETSQAEAPTNLPALDRQTDPEGN